MSENWLSDLDSDRALLLGGGLGLVLGADSATGRMVEDIDDHWFTAQVTITADGLLPEVGDIVIWRAEHVGESWMWNAPTRIIDVLHRGNDVEVTCLEDARLIEQMPGWIGPDLIAQDRVLTEDELWEFLSWWGLQRMCPRCGRQLTEIAYGLLLENPGPDVETGGCVIDPDAPTVRCRGCGWNNGERKFHA